MVRFQKDLSGKGFVFLLSFIALLTCIIPSHAAEREIVIVLKGGNNLRIEMYDKMAAAFEKARPEAKVTFINGREDKVLTMIAGGTPPNIFHSGQLLPEWSMKGMLFSIDGLLSADKLRLEDHFVQPAAVASRYRNETYAVPANINTEVLYYNRDMFAQAGLAEPSQVWKNPDWTWDAFRVAAKRLTRDTNGDGLPEVMGFEWLPVSSMIYSMIFGGHWVKPDPLRYTGDSREIEQGIRFWEELMHTDRSIAVPGNQSNYSFERGTAAMRWYNTGNLNSYTGLPFNWEIAAFPGDGVTQQFANRFVFVNGAPNQDLAFEFVKFIQMNVEWSSAFAEAWGGVPPLKKALPPFMTSRQYSTRQISVLSGALEVMFSPGAGIPGYADVDTAIKEGLQQAWSREVPLGTAMSNIRRKIDIVISSFPGF